MNFGEKCVYKLDDITSLTERKEFLEGQHCHHVDMHMAVATRTTVAYGMC